MEFGIDKIDIIKISMETSAVPQRSPCKTTT